MFVILIFIPLLLSKGLLNILVQVLQLITKQIRRELQLKAYRNNLLKESKY